MVYVCENCESLCVIVIPIIDNRFMVDICGFRHRVCRNILNFVSFVACFLLFCVFSTTNCYQSFHSHNTLKESPFYIN